MLALLANLALADTITLETGVTIEGDLARYEMGGDCQVSVTEGDLQGVIVIVPCHRIAAFVRAPREAPVLVGVIEPAVAVATHEESVVEDPTRYTADPFTAAEAEQARREVLAQAEAMREAAVAAAAAREAAERDAAARAELAEWADVEATYAEGDFPVDAPVVESSDDPPYGPDGDTDDDDAIVQPRAAPTMPAVGTRSISF